MWSSLSSAACVAALLPLIEGFAVVGVVAPSNQHPKLTSGCHRSSCVQTSVCSNRRTSSGLMMTSSLEGTTTAREYELLRGLRVNRAANGEELDLLDTWEPIPGKKTIVAFFTHTADFNSWEYAQKLRHYLPQIDDAGVNLVGVSLGTVDAARYFCAETGFPLANMFMDFNGLAYKKLGFSNGFEPRLPGDKKLNPYLRLLPMLAGIGSGGIAGFPTVESVAALYGRAAPHCKDGPRVRILNVEQVLRGYVGDPNDNADWISSALKMVDKKEFDILGSRGSRPLELATLRLQNMKEIVSKWNELAPPNKELITQQGGTLVFDGRDAVYSYKDKGILVYTAVLDMLESIGVEV